MSGNFTCLKSGDLSPYKFIMNIDLSPQDRPFPELDVTSSVTVSDKIKIVLPDIRTLPIGILRVSILTANEDFLLVEV